MLDLRTVKPGVAIGDVCLGMSEASIAGQLGPATESHRYSQGEFNFQKWFYPTHEIALDINRNWDKTTNIITWNRFARLDGMPIWGRSLASVLKTLDQVGYQVDQGSNTLENRKSEDFRIDLSERGFQLKFCEGVLRFIAVRPLMDGDRPIWPTQ